MRVPDELAPFAGPLHATLDLTAVQRRTLRLPFAMQIVGGVGVAIGGVRWSAAR